MRSSITVLILSVLAALSACDDDPNEMTPVSPGEEVVTIPDAPRLQPFEIPLYFRDSVLPEGDPVVPRAGGSPSLCGDGVIEGDETCDGETVACETACGSIGARTCRDCVLADECTPPWTRVELSIPPHRFFRALLGFGGDDLIAVGDEGIVQRFDGRAWSNLGSGYLGNFVGLWGSSPSEVFIVGGTRYPEPAGVVFHSDGESVRQIAEGLPGSLIDVWGASPSEVFAVGSHGLIARFDGRRWTAIDVGLEGDVRGIWGSDARNVYAVAETEVLHYDGVRWTRITNLFGRGASFRDVFGFAEDDVWFAGSGGRLFHFDGTEITRYPTPTTSRLERLWGAAPNDLYAVGAAGTVLHFDGSSWTVVEVEATEELRGVWGSAEAGVYISGEEATLLHRCGADES